MALRFVPYSDNGGHLHAGWAVVMGVLGLVVLAASLYLVYVLEILKFRRLTRIASAPPAAGRQRGRDREQVEEQLETGQFDAVQE